MTKADFIIALVVGAVIAIQSVTLGTFRHGPSTSKRYIPNWYQRVFSLAVGVGIGGWGLYHLLTR